MPSGYVGTDTCAACHEDIVKSFQRNPHHVVQVQKKRGWEGRACESCHGPGAKHAESTSPQDIFNPGKAAPRASVEDCMKCHLNTPTHVGRIRSSHAKDQVACVKCHSVHKGDEALRPRTAAAINELCAGCHQPVWAQFQRPYHHKLPERAMSCVDCHNPHAEFLPKMVRTVVANEPSCLKCHANLRGPFTFSHPPVEVEGCWQCHEPHGSANPRMLVRAEVRFVCLECHANVGAASNTIGGVPPSFHDLRSPRFRNCTICHQKIHGSYADPNLLR